MRVLCEKEIEGGGGWLRFEDDEKMWRLIGDLELIENVKIRNVEK